MKLEEPANTSTKSKVQSKNEEGKRVGKTSNEIFLTATDPWLIRSNFPYSEITCSRQGCGVCQPKRRLNSTPAVPAFSISIGAVMHACFLIPSVLSSCSL